MPTIRSDEEKVPSRGFEPQKAGLEDRRPVHRHRGQTCRDETERMARVGLAWHGLEDRPLTTSTPALLPNGRENGAVDGSRTRQILLTMEAPSHESNDGMCRSPRQDSNLQRPA